MEHDAFVMKFMTLCLRSICFWFLHEIFIQDSVITRPRHDFESRESLQWKCENPKCYLKIKSTFSGNRNAKSLFTLHILPFHLARGENNNFAAAAEGNLKCHNLLTHSGTAQSLYTPFYFSTSGIIHSSSTTCSRKNNG